MTLSPAIRSPMTLNPKPLRIFSAKTEAVLAVLGVLGALAFLFLFGIVGFLREGSFGFDFVVFHKAGVQFLDGLNPWRESIDSGGPFSYPPHLSVFIAFYGLFTFKVGLYIHAALNLVSIASIAFLANRWFIGITSLRTMNLAQGICLAFVIGNPFMAHSLYEGQWTLPAVAALFLSWHFLQKNHWLVAGIFLGLATIKPQVSVLYIVWLLLGLNFRVLFVGGALASIMLLPAIWSFGIVDMFLEWFASMDYYATQWANKPGSPHVVGLEGFFVSLGVQGSGVIFKVLSLVLVVALYLKREHFSPLLIVNLFLVAALTFIYGHDTDFVTLSLLWSYFVLIGFQQQSYRALVIVAGLLLLMFFPQRFIRAFDIPVLFHSRTFIVLISCWFIYAWETKLKIEAVSRKP